MTNSTYSTRATHPPRAHRQVPALRGADGGGDVQRLHRRAGRLRRDLPRVRVPPVASLFILPIHTASHHRIARLPTHTYTRTADSCFVEAADTNEAFLTVRETLLFAGACTLPVPSREAVESPYFQALVEQLNLDEGRKRRLLAYENVGDPKVGTDPYLVTCPWQGRLN